jgi:hypothetical protein
MDIVFRREKPFLGVDDVFLGVQATSATSFVEGENSRSYFSIYDYYRLTKKASK